MNPDGRGHRDRYHQELIDPARCSFGGDRLACRDLGDVHVGTSRPAMEPEASSTSTSRFGAVTPVTRAPR